MKTRHIVLIAQSGAPSPANNNSLRGTIDTCLAKEKIFGRIVAEKTPGPYQPKACRAME